MKLFECQKCANLLYFENTSCEKCGSLVGYLADQQLLSAVLPAGNHWTALAHSKEPYRFCANWENRACNWLITVASANPYCRACQHNSTIPDVTDPHNHALWVKMETAKRRLFYSLIKLRLPLPLRKDECPEPLEFDFLNDPADRQVMTGHDSGKITIALREADDAERERLRVNLHEPYRTLLGHFRHEVGHFYWDRLVRDGNRLEGFRDVFGDERKDYAAALAAYYKSGPPADWQKSYVSGYATMHPWEDFAETWAHYLHIVDTLEMGFAFGMTISPRLKNEHGMNAKIARDPYAMTTIDELLAAWLPITFAVNSLNRTMGQPDLYPFIISPPAAHKLDYIRSLVQTDAGVTTWRTKVSGSLKKLHIRS